MFCVPYTERFQNNFGLKFVQTNFSVFKIDNFKNTKIIFGAVRALDGILKVSHQILVFCYLSSLAKSTNKTKISLVFSSWRKNLWWKKTCSVYLTQNVSKNNFGLKFVQTNFSVFKIDNFKNTKIIFGAVRALDGILKVSHQILVSAICRAWQSRQIKTKISLVFSSWRKNLWWKRLVLCTLHRTFPKIILVWNLFKHFSVFKIDNFKNTKIIFGAVRALDGILKVSHQILVFAICRAWQSRQIKLRFH